MTTCWIVSGISLKMYSSWPSWVSSWITTMKGTCCKSSPNPLLTVQPSSLKSSSAKALVVLARATSKPSSRHWNANKNYEEICNMKLVTFRTFDRIIHAGVVHDEQVITLEYPTILELLRDPAGLTKARRALEEPGEAYTLNEVILLPPIPDPLSVRDFYAFEQHVKSARALRGLGMIPAWYEVPIFYFTNNSEIYGHEQPIPYPVGSKELDFELEIACVIGREGKDIPVEEAANYIAGYTIMNDWSARDLQRRDMKLNL